MIPTAARKSSGKRALVAGSLAFDQIMTFPGFFKDHILADRLHLINLSFLVDDFRKQRGGCAGNIAFTMALLGERPTVVATAGNDFGEYREWLDGEGIDTGEIRIDDGQVTASCFITTDKADNQIIGFFVGAMVKAREISLAEVAGRAGSPALAVVAPDDPEAMVRHCREAKRAGVPLVFDPSFQVIALDGDALREAADGAFAVILNDYEHAVLQEKTGLSEKELRGLAEMWVVTYGEKGSDIVRKSGERIPVPACAVEKVVDPTGAGDAFRGGFVTGLLRGAELPVCGRMGAVAAAYAIEHYGTQSHRYDDEAFWARYRQAFG